MEKRIKPKYSRDRFLTTNIIDGLAEKDLASCDISKLLIKRPLYSYRLNSVDIGRPDLVSLKIYGDIQYWWIILKYNAICDPFNEMYLTQTLYAPNEQDIQDWFLKVKV